ncbi:MAG: putative ABC transporter ATP-binding protein YbhF [Candidatus Heimdallarchaeota archaeon LC_2]|nr:MAG: putative ABC transporter ATP-binding protein YbhF [Candidatus Heimdallarchaeota archaeon LC_2]
MTQEVLRAVGVKKAYGDNVALENVDFDLRRGEIHSLLGPNGAGKTTLIKIMSTLLIKDAGTVNILGYDLDEHENQIRHLLGYVGQDTERSAYARLTPHENLRFFGSLRGLSKDIIDDKVYRFADMLDFNGNMDKQFMHLSGGQKQAVVIMRALLHEPPVIFLDEPTKGLDPLIAKKIRTFLSDLAHKEGKSLLLTSHILSEVDELSDRVSLIHGGTIPVTGTPSDLKAEVGAQEFIEIELGKSANGIVEKIAKLDPIINHKRANDDWISFGVTNFFEGTQAIMEVLSKEGLKPGFKHHSVTLEDAFIHQIGVLDEKFDH